MPVPNPLYLDSLRIEGARAIRRLVVRGLGRVNLFVGPNNAGKTSLLEALRLYAARGIPQAFRDILRGRGDFTPEVSPNNLVDWGILTEAVSSVFYGGFDPATDLKFSVGPTDEMGAALVIDPYWTKDSTGDFGRILGLSYNPVSLVLKIQYAGEHIADLPATQLAGRVHPTIENQTAFATYVPPCGVGEDRLGSLWDRVTLTPKEENVIDALRTIVPELEGLSYVQVGSRRVPVAKLRGEATPRPLQRMGDGVNRLLAIALALVVAEGGFLLIDEFENGLHYGVQANIWEIVFSLAEQLQVQVFATTHSWDCIVAFQYAANRSTSLGKLFRLNRAPDGDVFATAYSQEDVAIAAEQHIEVR